MRVGEILGLQWSSVHITDESIKKDCSTLEVKQELKRCDKNTLVILESKKRSNVYFTFPETKQNCRTSLVLKAPKTSTSLRSIYIPRTVACALSELRANQVLEKNRLHGMYQDFDMVIAQPDGRPTEERLIAKYLKALIKSSNLPEVVFHSLRHLSTSMKLQLSGGDIKAVQGDTGHAQASMVTNVYAHTFDENRRKIACKMENEFFEKKCGTQSEVSPEQSQILSLLNANPELNSLIAIMARKNA